MAVGLLRQAVNKILNSPAPEIHPSEKTLTHYTQRTLAQLRTNKSPLLFTYLHKIAPDFHPSPICPSVICNPMTQSTYSTAIESQPAWTRSTSGGGLLRRGRLSPDGGRSWVRCRERREGPASISGTGRGRHQLVEIVVLSLCNLADTPVVEWQGSRGKLYSLHTVR